MLFIDSLMNTEASKMPQSLAEFDRTLAPHSTMRIFSDSMLMLVVYPSG